MAAQLEWEKIWEEYKLPLIFGLLALILLGSGLLAWLGSRSSTKPSLEIISSGDSLENNGSQVAIFVDLQGAVQKPGLYELPSQSRLNDLLVRAGGLAAEADREWVAKNLNLAQKLSDGFKLYVPSLSEGSGDGGAESERGETAGATTKSSAKVGLNTASLVELDGLWGIGPVRGQAIIEGRPYSSLEELLSKKIIPRNVYERIKEQISLY